MGLLILTIKGPSYFGGLVRCDAVRLGGVIAKQVNSRLGPLSRGGLAPSPSNQIQICPTLCEPPAQRWRPD